MLKQLQTPIIIILFFFLCLFVYTKFVGPIPFSVNSTQTTKSNFFTTTGTGEVKAVPDMATVSLGVTVHAATADDAKNQINEVTNKVVSDLKALGIEEKDIQTTGFNVYEDPNAKVQPLSGPEPVGRMGVQIALPKPQSATAFTGSQTIEVHTKNIELANKAIDTASQDGANALNTPSFVVNDEKTKELTKQARKKAIDDAKQKAQELADEAGIKLGKVVDIQENSGGDIRPYAMSKAADTGQSTPTQLNPGENTISVSVTLSYETL